MTIREDMLNEHDEPKRCKLGRLIERLSDDDHKKLDAAMRRDDIATSRIAAVVSDHHERISEGVVARHRNRILGRVGCPKCQCAV